jgi:hypothetical protein
MRFHFVEKVELYQLPNAHVRVELRELQQRPIARTPETEKEVD